MNPDAPNPFAPPAASTELRTDPEPGDASLPRPRTPMVFGVLSLVVGALWVLVGFVGLAMMAAMINAAVPQPGMPVGAIATAYVWIASILNLVASGLLLAAGIFLVRYRKTGRPLFNAYAWMAIGLTLANLVYTYFTFNATLDQMAVQNPELAKPKMQAFMRASMTVGMAMPLLWLVFPVLGMVMLNRDRVKQSLT